MIDDPLPPDEALQTDQPIPHEDPAPEVPEADVDYIDTDQDEDLGDTEDPA